VIEPRTGPNGARVYRARVYYRGRYVASRTFTRKRDAQEWERKQVETLKTGAWADPKAGEKPVREWCDIWLSAQPARAQATERKLKGVIGKQIAGTFGRRPLVSVRPSEVQAWAAEISRKQSPATARHSLGVLRRVFDHAVRDGAIHRNPAAGIKLPKVQGNDPQPLTHAELWQLADHLRKPRDRLLVLVGGYCGLRWGELAALRWGDVDLVRSSLRVVRAFSEEAERGQMSPVKDHQARTVPVPAIVLEELVIFGERTRPDQLVFPSASSTPLRNRNFRRDVFDEAVADVGLEITPHNLRDTAASLAIQAGASVVAVARLLGHESAATTLNHYAALFPSDLDDVAVRLDAAARKIVRENSAVGSAMSDRRRWICSHELSETLNDLPAGTGLLNEVRQHADDHLFDVHHLRLRSEEHERWLMANPGAVKFIESWVDRNAEDPGRDIHDGQAAGRLTDDQPAPSDSTEAPTTYRPERNGEE
jgi:integrase